MTTNLLYWNCNLFFKSTNPKKILSSSHLHPWCTTNIQSHTINAPTSFCQSWLQSLIFLISTYLQWNSKQVGFNLIIDTISLCSHTLANAYATHAPCAIVKSYLATNFWLQILFKFLQNKKGYCSRGSVELFSLIPYSHSTSILC